jgi:hypothetical protein
MELAGETLNKCPVCDNQVEETNSMYCCETCGFNIDKRPEQKQNAAHDGESLSMKDFNL